MHVLQSPSMVEAGIHMYRREPGSLSLPDAPRALHFGWTQFWPIRELGRPMALTIYLAVAARD